MDADKTLFGDNERNLLKYSIQIRTKMVESKVKTGIEDNRDIRVVNETLNGLDTSLLALAKLDQDEAKNQQNNESQANFLAILKNKKYNLPKPTNTITKEIPHDVYDGEILDTELVECGALLNPADFLDDN